MRTSNDEYIMPNGEIISIGQSVEPPKGAKIYNGYDYINQCWIYKGERDTRTLEELRACANH